MLPAIAHTIVNHRGATDSKRLGCYLNRRLKLQALRIVEVDICLPGSPVLNILTKQAFKTPDLDNFVEDWLEQGLLPVLQLSGIINNWLRQVRLVMH